MKQTSIKKAIPDAVALSAELDSIAAGINLCFVIVKEWDDPKRPYDQPSAESLAEMLWGAEQHLLRVSEDWLIYTEMLEGRTKELSADQRGKGVENV